METPTKEILRKIVLFSNFKDDELEEISSFAFIRKFKKGDYIFREGDIGGGFFVILEGSVEVRKRLPDGDEIVIATLGHGDSLGESDVVSRVPERRMASCVASSDVKAINILRSGIEKGVETGSKGAITLFRTLATTLARRLRIMDDAHIRLFLETKGKDRLNELKAFREKLFSKRNV